jgi:hypothetical protein
MSVLLRHRLSSLVIAALVWVATPPAGAQDLSSRSRFT